MPKTAKTLLRCPSDTSSKIISLSGGQYFYFGLQSQLITLLKKYDTIEIANLQRLDISFNIDGLPLFNSSKIGFWPILCTVCNIIPQQVIVVGLFCGITKPSDLDFLNDTINELEDLLLNGLLFLEKTLPVSVKSIVCDAPARAMVKSTKLYSGYYGCDQCTDLPNLNLRKEESRSFCIFGLLHSY